MYSKKIGVFSFLVLFSIIFNGYPIVKSAFSDIVLIYLLFVFLMLIGLSISLNKSRFFSISIFDIQCLSHKKVRIVYYFYIVAMLYFLAYNIEAPLAVFYEKNLAYSIRLDAISFKFYWIFDGVAKIGFALSIVYLLRQDFGRWFVSTFLYILFYAASLQKAPISTIFLVQLLIYGSVFPRSPKFWMVGGFSTFSLLAYYMIVVLGDLDFDRVDLLAYSIINRVSGAGDLIVFIYKYFSSTEKFLGGSTLPKIFGLLDINTSGYAIRLPSFIMALTTGEEGGANTSFFTEGFANFGYGMDILFIIIMFLFVAFMFFIARRLGSNLFTLYKLSIAVLLIDIVHSDFWGVFHVSFILLFIMFSAKIATGRHKSSASQIQ